MAKWQNGKKNEDKKNEDKKSRGTQDVLLKKLHMKKMQKNAKNAKNANLQKGNEW